MSSRTYELRARARTGIPTRTVTDRALEESESPSLVNLDDYTSEMAPRQEEPVPVAEAMTRSYSDVVASRPTSPPRERPTLPSVRVGSPVNLDSTRMPVASNNGSNDDRNEGSRASEVPAESVETPDKAVYDGWIRIQRKRARSDGSLPNRQNLTSVQREVVQIAEKGLTKEQQQKLQRRQEKVRPRRDSSVSSRGEGTSKRKGKNIDPRNWGNVDFGRESLDIDAQIAALCQNAYR